MAWKSPLSKIGAVVLVGLMAACGGKPSTAPTGGVSSMQSVEIKPGTGVGLTAGQIAVVQYTGWLYDAAAKDNKGKQFDS
jgi:FKBP-type peptidyl-prolyl cis-trans isomerase FkpA